MSAREEPLSQRAYARRRNVSHTAVQRAIADGRLVDSVIWTKGRKYPRILASVADTEWDRNLVRAGAAGAIPASASGSGPSDEAEKGEPEPSQASLPGMEDTDPPAATNGRSPDDLAARRDYQKTRAERETWDARLARLRYQERAAELVPAVEVRAAARALGGRVRDAVLAIADRLSPVLASIDDEVALRVRLRAELVDALRSVEAPSELDRVAPPPTDDEGAAA